MSLCRIPYFYSEEFKDIYYSTIDFLCVDKEIEPKRVMFDKTAIYIQSFYTNCTEKDGLVDSSLIILLDYGENQIERDTVGYEVMVHFYLAIKGKVVKDEEYRKEFKNLENIEDYNKWVEFKYNITPWLIKFKKYQNT